MERKEKNKPLKSSEVFDRPKIMPPDRDFISAREVADILNINEKKVYTLVQDGKIPGTKVTGKWLFPKRELEELLRSKATQTIRRFSTEYAFNRSIVLLAGSDDPIIYMAQGLLHSKYPDFVLFSASVGSGEGLKLLKKGCCHIALSHLYDHNSDDYNFPFIRGLFDRPNELVIVNLFYRNIGFLSKGAAVKTFKEIISNDLSFVNRQKGSGIRSRVDSMIAKEDVDCRQIRGYGEEVYTHLDVAYHIISGRADAGVAAQSVAPYSNLYFHKLFQERFDMVVYKDAFFEKNIQVFVEFIRSDVFLNLLKSMGGYDGRDTGKILYSKKSP